MTLPTFRFSPTLPSLVVICFTLLALAPRAWSQSGERPRLTPEQKQKVTEHYDKATRLYYVGKYDEALVEYQAAYLVSADPVMLYNIGQCHRLADRPEEAARFYRNYLRVAPEAPNRVAVEKQIEAMDKLAAEKTGGKPGAPAPPASASPPPVGAPDPTAPPPVVGPEPGTRPAETAPTTAGPPPFPTAPPPPFQTGPPPVTSDEAGTGEPGGEITGDTEGESAHGPSRVVPLSLMIGGGALIVTSTVFGLAAAAKANAVEERAMMTDPVFDGTVQENERAGRTASALAVLTGLVGVAAGTTGVILWIRSAAAADAQEEQFPPLGSRIFPLLGPGLAGAGARVTF